jgi:HAD superfamily hydrolase (TIGR01509 family)
MSTHQAIPDRPLGLLFDMDGVLLDSRAMHGESWLEWARQLGFEIEIDSFMARTFGKSLEQILPEFFPSKAADRAFLRQMGEAKEQCYRDLMRRRGVAPLGGLCAFLRRASAMSISLIVGSSGPRENVATTIECLRFSAYFERFVSGDDVEHGKPAPDIFLRCANHLRLEPGRCLVFEDSLPGLQAAAAAGCPAVAVATMHPRERLREHTPYVIGDFTEALAWLESWNRPGGSSFPS